MAALSGAVLGGILAAAIVVAAMRWF